MHAGQVFYTIHLQESQVEPDKIRVAQILKEHNVLVRGGPEQGTKLMDALVVGTSCSSSLQVSNTAAHVVHFKLTWYLFDVQAWKNQYSS